MGYDCTLHVVDEQLVRDLFVPRFLGRSTPRTPFDDRPDHEELWSHARQALADLSQTDILPGSVSQIANTICQLAVAFCAAQLPYHYERGFCLSLWPEEPDGLDARVPKKFLGDPATLFDELVTSYPNLRGRFPKEIQSNGCTGHFVPSENVPALLAWVEKRVKRYSKPDRRLFRGLLLVLQHAAAHGFAYWEGTDLPVRMATMQPPVEQRRVDLKEVPIPIFAHDFKHRCGDLLVFSSPVFEKGAPGAVFVDLSCWPPRMQELPEYTKDVDSSRGGLWLMVSESGLGNGRWIFEVRIRDKPLSPNFRVLRAELHPPELSMTWAGLMGERVVAELEYVWKRRVKRVPMLQHGDLLRDAKGARPAADGHGRDGKHAEIMCPGIAHLRDGADVLIWGERGYELRGERLVATFDLGMKAEYDWSYLPVGDDGFFCVLNRELFEVHRGLAPRLHLPKLTNVMFLTPGPGNAIVLREGNNKLGDLGKIYFPDEDTYIRIEPELFEDEDPDEIRSLHWAGTCGQFVAATPKRLWAVPVESVLALPRYRANSGRKIRS